MKKIICAGLTATLLASLSFANPTFVNCKTLSKEKILEKIKEATPENPVVLVNAHQHIEFMFMRINRKKPETNVAIFSGPKISFTNINNNFDSVQKNPGRKQIFKDGTKKLILSCYKNKFFGKAVLEKYNLELKDFKACTWKCGNLQYNLYRHTIVNIPKIDEQYDDSVILPELRVNKQNGNKCYRYLDLSKCNFKNNDITEALKFIQNTFFEDDSRPCSCETSLLEFVEFPYNENIKSQLMEFEKSVMFTPDVIYIHPEYKRSMVNVKNSEGKKSLILTLENYINAMRKGELRNTAESKFKKNLKKANLQFVFCFNYLIKDDYTDKLMDSVKEFMHKIVVKQKATCFLTDGYAQTNKINDARSEVKFCLEFLIETDKSEIAKTTHENIKNQALVALKQLVAQQNQPIKVCLIDKDGKIKVGLQKDKKQITATLIED